MGLLNSLSQMISSGSVNDHNFDQAAQSAPTDVVGKALSGMFSSNTTPPIGQMVGQLFGNSNGSQQAGMLNQLISAVGPTLAATLGGGVLGRIMSPGSTQITPEQASQLTPQQVQVVVDHAHESQPGIADQLGNFYAQHSGLIKVLGGAAMLVALTKMKDHLGQS